MGPTLCISWYDAGQVARGVALGAAVSLYDSAQGVMRRSPNGPAGAAVSVSRPYELYKAAEIEVIVVMEGNLVFP